MKQIELKKMDIRNFKGIEILSVDFGERTDIYGDNATGKTSIYDAFTWLLFGKDSAEKADFEIKPLNAQGEVKNHEAQTEVTAELLIDGEMVTLSKAYKEKWTKQKGSAEAALNGHTTKYEIDGVPRKKSEFEAYIKDIIAEDKFRLLSDVEAFSRLNWKDRRNIIMSVCGEPSVDMVMAQNAELKPLESLMGKYSIEDIKKKYNDRRKAINAERTEIPNRIDENLRLMNEDAEAVDIDTARKYLKSLEDKLAETEQRKRAMEQGDAKETEILKYREKLGKLEIKNRAYQVRQSEEHAKANAELRDKRSKLDNVILNRKFNIQDLQTRIERAKADRENLIAEYKAIKAEQWTGDTICPTCGQELPEDKIEESKAKFNLSKSERLTQNKAVGQEKRAQIDTMEAQLEEAENDLKLAREELDSLPIPEPFTPSNMDGFEDMAEYLNFKIFEAENAPEDKTRAVALESINAEIDVQRDAIEREKEKIFNAEQTAKQRERIEELKAKEKALAVELEDVERVLFAADEYMRTKVALIENHVSEKFKKARFKMFDLQVNGGIAECCKITYDGVPYDSLNNAARINIGIDIINTLAEHYGVCAPVWVDNAESVVNIEPSDGQQIRLIVSAGDKELRVAEVA